jgi:tetratricopeptide (TPR) repeat protein
VLADCPPIELFAQLLECEPSRDVVERVSAHVDGCRRCFALLVELARTEAVADSAGAASLPAGSSGTSAATLSRLSWKGVARAAALLDARPPGSRVGRYVIERTLGVGGMGVVYAARDPDLDRLVAVKLLRADLPGSGEQQRRLLMREAHAMARLRHANVVTVYEVGTDGDRAFIAMEYVDGGTLRTWLAEAPRSWREVARMFVAAGEGLRAAHAVGLVHRDFKPDNVLLGRDGRARVTDFGLVHPTGPRPPDDGELSPSPVSPLYTEITGTGRLVGTPAYMAPEQLRGERCDARSDVFSFCVALYEGLYGERPFAATFAAELPAEIARGEVRKPPATIRVPPRLRNILLRGLSARPDDRFATMDALLTELSRDPAVTRRRWLQSGLIVALLATLPAGWLASRRAQQHVCQGGAHKLDGIWDAARKQHVRDTFLATRSPYAESAFEVVSRGLDRAAASWLSMYVDACAATRVRGEQSEELLDLRMECLDGKRRALAAATDLFSHADTQVVERAAEVTAGIGSLAACADTASLRAATRPPADPVVKRRVDELRDRLATVAALKFAGKYDDAVAQSSALVAAGRALGYRPVEAEAQLMLGQVQRRLRLRDAAKTLRQAVIAAEATRQDHVAAEAWTELAEVDGRIVEARGPANEDIQHAEAYLARMGQDDALGAKLSSIAGQLLITDGKFKEARAPLERALALARREYGEEHPLVAYYWQQYGFVLNQIGDKAAAETATRRGLAITERLHGLDHPDTAQALIWLGVQLATENQNGEARVVFRRAIAIIEETRGRDSPDLIWPLGRLADSLAVRGHNDALPEQLALHQRAVAIARKSAPQGSQLGYALALLASAYANAKECGKALAALDEAQEILERVGERGNGNFAWLVLGNRGHVLHQLHRDKEAIPPLEEALRSELAPQDAAGVRFMLAQSLWTDRRERARAVGLAREARDYFRADSSLTERVAEVDNWLAENDRVDVHGPLPSPSPTRARPAP